MFDFEMTEKKSIFGEKVLFKILLLFMKRVKTLQYSKLGPLVGRSKQHPLRNGDRPSFGDINWFT